MASSPPPHPTPEQLVAELVLLLDLEPKGGDRFIGRRREDGTGRVFGGQAVAQALGAARRTVSEERAIHSLHAYFLRPGTDDLPIEYRVKRDLDGRSFSNRRVVAVQKGEPILNLTASFQIPVAGPGHQHLDMAEVPPPEALKPDALAAREIAEAMPEGPTRKFLLRPHPIDMRSVEPRNWFGNTPREPQNMVWFRTVAPLPADHAYHRTVLAFVSDYQILASALLPHGTAAFDNKVKVASLDHAIWFHDDFAVDDWLLYVTDSPWSGAGRGFARGQIYTRDGRLVASVAQEGMIRHL